VSEAELVILASDDGRTNWSAVKPADVPAWVKAPDNIAKMLAGLECMKADEGDKGSMWYRAIPAEDYELMLLAQQRRDARNEKRLH